MSTEQTSATTKNTKKSKNIIRKLYDWVLHWANTPYGLPALFLISFLESSFFPIPPDVLLVPLVLGAATKWWRFALWCTVASVLGALLGYFIGFIAWEGPGKWILQNIIHINLVDVAGRQDIPLPHYLTNNFSSSLGGDFLFQVYDKWNAWIVFVFGLTPLPFKLVTITAGVAKVDLVIFTFASIISRGIRFFAVAYILKLWGEPAKKFLDQHFNKAVIAFTVLLIGSFVLIKLILS